MLSLEDKQELEDFCNARYVRKDDCVERKEAIDKRFANDDKRIEMIAHDFGVFKRLLWLIATAVTAEVAVLVVDMIIK